MAKLIIGVEAVGVRALAGPVTSAAVLFDASVRAPIYEKEVRGRRVRYTLDDAKKIPVELRPHIIAHIKRIALSYACVHRPGGMVTNSREAAWYTMGQAAARAAERAVHTEREAVQVGTDELEIYIPTGGYCPYAVVGRIGQRPMPDDWHRGAAYLMAKAAHEEVMRTLHQRFPMYDFETNHGNLSLTHKRALRRYGRTPEHRGTA